MHQTFQVNKLEYLEEAMTLYGTYSATSIEEIVNAINHVHKNITKYEKMLSGRQPYLERRNPHMIPNSLLYIYMSYKSNMSIHRRI